MRARFSTWSPSIPGRPMSSTHDIVICREQGAIRVLSVADQIHRVGRLRERPRNGVGEHRVIFHQQNTHRASPRPGTAYLTRFRSNDRFFYGRPPGRATEGAAPDFATIAATAQAGRLASDALRKRRNPLTRQLKIPGHVLHTEFPKQTFPPIRRASAAVALVHLCAAYGLERPGRVAIHAYRSPVVVRGTDVGRVCQRPVHLAAFPAGEGRARPPRRTAAAPDGEDRQPRAAPRPRRGRLRPAEPVDSSCATARRRGRVLHEGYHRQRLARVYPDRPGARASAAAGKR